jgi:hypothetical protein
MCGKLLSSRRFTDHADARPARPFISQAWGGGTSLTNNAPRPPSAELNRCLGESNPSAGISVAAVLKTSGVANMRSHLYGAIAIAAMIATPAMAQTTTPTSNTMSTPGPGAGTSTPTLSHDGSASLTNANASRASNSPGAGASPHTGFSSGMTPSAGTASGTADGTTDTGATSPGSGKSAAQR